MNMEAAINTLTSQYKTYAGNDGSGLNTEEFRKMVKVQLPNLVKNPDQPGVVEELMGSQDKDNDGELTFTEFWDLIGRLASKEGGFSQ